MGSAGRGFFADLSQASGKYIGYAFLGGVVFNIANILLVAAIDIAGMAVAFPGGHRTGAGDWRRHELLAKPGGNPGSAVHRCGVRGRGHRRRCDGVSPICRRPGRRRRSRALSCRSLCGILMGQFFQFVARSMPDKLGRDQTLPRTPAC